MLRARNGKSPKLKDLQSIERRMLYPYYENGEEVIVLGGAKEMMTPLNIDDRTLPRDAKYIMAFAHIPHPYFRDDQENPTLDMGAVLPLTASDLEAIARIAQTKLLNISAEYDSGRSYFRFRDGIDTFYFDVHDRTRTVKADYGIGACYVFDKQKLQEFIKLLRS